jgi:hypothetical protein
MRELLKHREDLTLSVYEFPSKVGGRTMSEARSDRLHAT